MTSHITSVMQDLSFKSCYRAFAYNIITRNIASETVVMNRYFASRHFVEISLFQQLQMYFVPTCWHRVFLLRVLKPTSVQLHPYRTRCT